MEEWKKESNYCRIRDYHILWTSVPVVPTPTGKKKVGLGV